MKFLKFQPFCVKILYDYNIDNDEDSELADNTWDDLDIKRLTVEACSISTYFRRSYLNLKLQEMSATTLTLRQDTRVYMITLTTYFRYYLGEICKEALRSTLSS